MAIQKYISDIKTVNSDSETVYNRLSNLDFLNSMFGPENMSRAKEQMGDKAKGMDIQNFTADRDSCSFDLPPIGNIALHIEEREEYKLVKIVSDDSTKFDFKLWIQLIPSDELNCKMRITLHVELNMMMKMMVGKKLDKGINQIADGIANIPYGTI
ncbi:MAG: hypothetical protein KAG84_08750 [Bacteroidales bacterium]|nr:hypothetical protein [Bacteroidales bacterium]